MSLRTSILCTRRDNGGRESDEGFQTFAAHRLIETFVDIPALRERAALPIEAEQRR